MKTENLKTTLPVSCDDRQHVGRRTGSGLSDFESHVPQVHDSKAHVFQHGQLLTWTREGRRTVGGGDHHSPSGLSMVTGWDTDAR